MMTLKELLTITYEDVAIMDGTRAMLVINRPYDNYNLLSTELTASIVHKVSCGEGCIKIWVKSGD